MPVEVLKRVQDDEGDVQDDEAQSSMAKVLGNYCYCEPIAKIASKMVRSAVEFVIIGA